MGVNAGASQLQKLAAGCSTREYVQLHTSFLPPPPLRREDITVTSFRGVAETEEWREGGKGIRFSAGSAGRAVAQKKLDRKVLEKEIGPLGPFIHKGKPQNMTLPAEVPYKEKQKVHGKYVEAAKAKARKLKKLNTPQLPKPPIDGTLVPELIPVAHKVLKWREEVIDGCTRLLAERPAWACSWCPEVSVGKGPHEIPSCTGPGTAARRGRHEWVPATVEDVFIPMDCFHMPDFLGPPVTHDRRFGYERVPAIVELCVQAGVDIPGLETRRRSEPMQLPRAEVKRRLWGLKQGTEKPVLVPGNIPSASVILDPLASVSLPPDEGNSADKTNRITSPCGEAQASSSELAEAGSGLETWEDRSEGEEDDRASWQASEPGGGQEREMSLAQVAQNTVKSYMRLQGGIGRLLGRYPVKRCGYCPEIQVGLSGHRVRLCGAPKHQQRNGQHGWRSAEVDDILRPNYVWHLREHDGPPLVSKLKRFYGQAPAVVELCLQAGAQPPPKYVPMLRLDVAIPDPDEAELVV